MQSGWVQISDDIWSVEHYYNTIRCQRRSFFRGLKRSSKATFPALKYYQIGNKEMHLCVSKTIWPFLNYAVLSCVFFLRNILYIKWLKSQSRRVNIGLKTPSCLVELFFCVSTRIAIIRVCEEKILHLIGIRSNSQEIYHVPKTLMTGLD